MYLIKAKQKSKFLFHIRDPIENATQNPAYGVTPNLVAMDNQRGSRSMKTAHIYHTISDNSVSLPSNTSNWLIYLLQTFLLTVTNIKYKRAEFISGFFIVSLILGENCIKNEISLVILKWLDVICTPSNDTCTANAFFKYSS